MGRRSTGFTDTARSRRASNGTPVSVEYDGPTRERRHMPKSRCPCCGRLTLIQPAAFIVCPVCFWEDDGQGDHDADAVRGGPNHSLSLTQARANFLLFGACDRRHIASVRPALPDETPPAARAADGTDDGLSMDDPQVFFILQDHDGDLWSLSRTGHVWLAHSPTNDEAARRVWDREPGDYSPLHGVTMFPSSSDRLADFYEFLATIDEHHGTYSAPTAWGVIQCSRGSDRADRPCSHRDGAG